MVDYRPINKLTVVDKYPLSRIDEMRDILGDASYFSKVDLYSGLHKTRVFPEHSNTIRVPGYAVWTVQRACDISKDHGLYFPT